MKSLTVLKLKLQPDESAAGVLSALSGLCRTGWNAAVEDWLLRHRGKPESPKQSKPGRPNKKTGEVKALSEATKLYHAITAAVPDLGVQQASMLASAINSHLNAKVDWRRGTDNSQRMKRRDAILAYDDRPPFRTSHEIPLPNSQTNLHFTDRLFVETRRPLRHVPNLRVELSLRRLPPGHQSILRDIATGNRRLQDSKLVQKDGEWFWHLPVTFETELRSDVSATLWPTIGGDRNARPFTLQLPDGRNWGIGDGRYLLAKLERLTVTRKMIGWRHRQGLGAGHGRKKIDAAVRRRRQQQQNVVAEVRRRAIADVVRQCVRHGVGQLIYREPTGPVRKKAWFAEVGLDWDWTRFRGDLTNACARSGITVKAVPLKWKDITDKEPAHAA